MRIATDTSSLIKALDLCAENTRMASLTFSINLFTDVLLTEIPNTVLRCQELFFEFCPKEMIKFYATENMHKHRAVTKKVFDMLKIWMENPESKTDYISLELKDGNVEQDAPKYLFKVTGCEKNSIGYKEKLANSISFAFPPEYGLNRSSEMLILVKKICEIFPFQSGNAGFAFHCSRYFPQKGEAFAWQKSMRHPEIDIVRIPQDIHAVQQNAIKTISWLTMANNDTVSKLGGINRIEDYIDSHTHSIKTKYGYIFQIDDFPTISDRNRGEIPLDYTNLYQVFKPFITTASEQSLWFDTGGQDEDEQTKTWYKRFEK